MQTWRAAMQQALYGPHGYYIRGGRGPGQDYRTSSTASPAFAAAIVRLATAVDDALGHPAHFDFVEVAAADGRLLKEVRTAVAVSHPDLAARIHLRGVDLAPRPANLDPSIGWSHEIPEHLGLLFANEWLDNVPLDVVELADDGLHLVLVDEEGTESLGPPPPADDVDWLDQWWPLTEPGDRAEVGRTRDLAWASAVERLTRGQAVTADYATLRADRVDGSYAGGTLVGYRDGHVTVPRPDGESDITAHIAIDSAAAAVRADHTAIKSQRDMLRSLGVSGARPDLALATTDPAAYTAALQTCSAEAELIASGGLGALTWLMQSKNCPALALG